MLVVKTGIEVLRQKSKVKSRLGISGTPRPGPVAGLDLAVVDEGGFHVAVGFGVGALGTVAGRVGDFDKAPAVEHKAPPYFSGSAECRNAAPAWNSE